MYVLVCEKESSALLVCQFNRYQLPKNLTGCKEKRIRYFGHAEIFLWIRAISDLKLWLFFDGCLDVATIKNRLYLFICITNNTKKSRRCDQDMVFYLNQRERKITTMRSQFSWSHIFISIFIIKLLLLCVKVL